MTIPYEGTLQLDKSPKGDNYKFDAFEVNINGRKMTLTELVVWATIGETNLRSDLAYITGWMSATVECHKNSSCLTRWMSTMFGNYKHLELNRHIELFEDKLRRLFSASFFDSGTKEEIRVLAELMPFYKKKYGPINYENLRRLNQELCTKAENRPKI